ncbi:hypothetical protein EV659_102212 [Rhodothalassium salexigens DSM 2132]|uniref:Uncharacterized protein n=1 Tax=Rhodothalassium salexigens DSM 2132 TaxID=1188247 RepID=A0A4R2PUI5_RHOSA|nr:hypothetical protein EV659_102212 [Rhodothalassium salexigens DSM 2132]
MAIRRRGAAATAPTPGDRAANGPGHHCSGQPGVTIRRPSAWAGKTAAMRRPRSRARPDGAAAHRPPAAAPPLARPTHRRSNAKRRVPGPRVRVRSGIRRDRRRRRRTRRPHRWHPRPGHLRLCRARGRTKACAGSAAGSRHSTHRVMSPPSHSVETTGTNRKERSEPRLSPAPVPFRKPNCAIRRGRSQTPPGSYSATPWRGADPGKSTRAITSNCH